MDPVTVVIIVVVGTIGGIWLSRRAHKLHAEKYGEISGSAPADDSKLLGGTVTHANEACESPSQETIPEGQPFSGAAPVPGKASVLTFQWRYGPIKEGESAGSIAQAIVGDSRRYVELLSANSDKRMVTVLKGGKPEINFAQGKGGICVGERLYIPKSWNAWIDEAMNLRGQVLPFAPYDKLPGYPFIDPTGITAGFVPWPPEAPTGWGAIPMPGLGGV